MTSRFSLPDLSGLTQQPEHDDYDNRESENRKQVVADQGNRCKDCRPKCMIDTPSRRRESVLTLLVVVRQCIVLSGLDRAIDGHVGAGLELGIRRCSEGLGFCAVQCIPVCR